MPRKHHPKGHGSGPRALQWHQRVKACEHVQEAAPLGVRGLKILGARPRAQRWPQASAALASQPLADRQVPLSFLGVCSTPSLAFSTQSKLPGLLCQWIATPPGIAHLVNGDASVRTTPTSHMWVWTEDGACEFQHLRKHHGVLCMYLPLTIRFSQDITLGTLHLHVGKATPRLHLPDQPAKKGAVSRTPSPLDPVIAALSCFAWGYKGRLSCT